MKPKVRRLVVIMGAAGVIGAAGFGASTAPAPSSAGGSPPASQSAQAPDSSSGSSPSTSSTSGTAA
jgi:hypothetical protein